MKRFINSSVSPNLEKNDVLTAVKMLFTPFGYDSGNFVNKVETWFKYNFSRKFAYTFSSAREAEFALFNALGIGSGDEVILQSFTCLAVVNPILWAGAKPVYVDVDKDTISINISDLRKKITKRTKVIILQYTFGMPGKIEEIRKIALENKIFLLEDCAHVIGGTYKNKKLGEWGDGAIFSFGRDKAVSSVFGGIIVTNKAAIGEKIRKLKEASPYPSSYWTIKQLLHPIFTFIVIYAFNLHPLFGKVIFYIIKELHIITLPIQTEIKKQNANGFITKKYPNALAALAFNQLLKINKFNRTRLDIYRIYKTELSKINNKLNLPDIEAYYLRVPVRVSNKKILYEFCKERSVYLGNWYSNVIDPVGVDYKKIYYKKGQCKVAEGISKRILNLPCYPTMSIEDAKKVTDMIKSYYERKI